MEINGRPVNFGMKLSECGKAYFGTADQFYNKPLDFHNAHCSIGYFYAVLLISVVWEDTPTK